MKSSRAWSGRPSSCARESSRPTRPRRWSRIARTWRRRRRRSSSSSRAPRRRRHRLARTPCCRAPRPAVIATYPENLRQDVERYLEGMRFSEEALTAGLEEAMRSSLLAGGKRIRPVLALATARAVGLEQREVLPLAGAIDLIHTYSLIHDDLPAMDDDDLRRGQPTCHVKFGEDVAILAGDGLYAEAFHHLLTHQQAGPERLLQAASELAAATGVNGMVGGQYADVSADT